MGFKIRIKEKEKTKVNKKTMRMIEEESNAKKLIKNIMSNLQNFFK
jgi:hypothetical protein